MKKLVVAILFSGLLALFAVILPTFAALAQSGPPNAHPLMTYGEWNAAWWQWFFSVPASKNPGLLSTEAVDCSMGQTGDAWFLAGHFNGGGSFTHRCTVPGGKTLVIPLINSWADNVCNKPPLTVDTLRNIAANFVTPASNLHARIDVHRVLIPLFVEAHLLYCLGGGAQEVASMSQRALLGMLQSLSIT